MGIFYLVILLSEDTNIRGSLIGKSKKTKIILFLPITTTDSRPPPPRTRVVHGGYLKKIKFSDIIINKPNVCIFKNNKTTYQLVITDIDVLFQ